MCELCIFKSKRKVYFLTDKLTHDSNSPNHPITTGAQDTGGNCDPSDSPLLSPALPQPRGALLYLAAPGHHRPFAGRLGTQAGIAGEAVGEWLID